MPLSSRIVIGRSSLILAIATGQSSLIIYKIIILIHFEFYYSTKGLRWITLYFFTKSSSFLNSCSTSLKAVLNCVRRFEHESVYLSIIENFIQQILKYQNLEKSYLLVGCYAISYVGFFQLFNGTYYYKCKKVILFIYSRILNIYIYLMMANKFAWLSYRSLSLGFLYNRTSWWKELKRILFWFIDLL